MPAMNAEVPIEVFTRHESNVRSYCRRFPAVFSRAQDSRVYDVDGNFYLDLLSGAGTLNYGHNNPAIVDPVILYLSNNGIVHGMDMYTEAKADFIQTFHDRILVPRKMHYKLQFPGPTGANAVEAAFKLARKRTGRRTIVSFTNAYHGMTMGALAATANCPMNAGTASVRDGVIFMPYDGFLPAIDCIEVVEGMMRGVVSKVDAPAAFIFETIQGEGGLNTATAKWIKRLGALADEIGALLIVDDIQAGNGRTGTFFSFEDFGISPDLILLSKSLSGFGTPLSLVLVKPEVDVWSPGEHTGTFRGNNLAFIGATAAIESYWRDETLSSRVSRNAALVAESLSAIVSELPKGVAFVKGRGLFQGIGFSDTSVARLVSKRLFGAGFIVETCGPNDEVLKFLPPLTISHEDLTHALTQVAETIIGKFSTRSRVA